MINIKLPEVLAKMCEATDYHHHLTEIMYNMKRPFLLFLRNSGYLTCVELGANEKAGLQKTLKTLAVSGV